MLTEPLFLLAALGIFLTLLVLVQLFLAARHDHVVAAAPRFSTLESLDQQIVVKRETLLDLDADLQKRRNALADLSGMAAEVEALTTKRDEVLTEWASLEAKRDEVRAMRAETEQAWQERQSALAELATLQEEHGRVRERLDRAEDLIGQIAVLEDRHSALKAEVVSLDDTARRLREAQEEFDHLQSRSDIVRREIAEMEGRHAAAHGELAELSARLTTERGTLAGVAAELTDARARLATAEESLRALETRHRALESQAVQLADVAEHLTEERRQLSETKAVRRSLDAGLAEAEQTLAEARDAERSMAAVEEMLRRKRAELDGTAGATGDEASVEDRLKELNTRPPVLQQLSLWPTWKPGRDRQPEADALHRVSERFIAVGLEYHPRTQRAFHTAMKVNATTQMTVLAGISGTGKSQLPRQYAAGMGIGFLQVPVQPRWDSPQDLMGFYNYIEGRFRPTDMARALWQMDELNNPDALQDRLLMVLLDEMNLARVEYYFSDFLSRLESRPAPQAVDDRTLRKDAEIELEIPMPRGMDAKRVFPGYNLLFAGTMNEDESTQSLSDKVVDRANVLRFGAPKKIAGTAAQDRLPETEAMPLDQWRRWVRSAESVARESRVPDALDQMSELMRGFGRPFGHRLGRAVLAYVANYPETEGSDRLAEALADQVEMRLLPKLRGVEVDSGEAEEQFGELRSFVERDLRDDLLAQAIDDAVASARQGSGQFVWTGVTR